MLLPTHLCPNRLLNTWCPAHLHLPMPAWLILSPVLWPPSCNMLPWWWFQRWAALPSAWAGVTVGLGRDRQAGILCLRAACNLIGICLVCLLCMVVACLRAFSTTTTCLPFWFYTDSFPNILLCLLPHLLCQPPTGLSPHPLPLLYLPPSLI